MKVSPRFPSPKRNKLGARSKGQGRGVAEAGLANPYDKGERLERGKEEAEVEGLLFVR